MARDVAQQMCDTLEGKGFTGVVNVSFMAVANEVRYSPVPRFGSIPVDGNFPCILCSAVCVCVLVLVCNS